MDQQNTIETLEELVQHLTKRLYAYKDAATKLKACLYCECRVGFELCPECLDARENFEKILKNEPEAE